MALDSDLKPSGSPSVAPLALRGTSPVRAGGGGGRDVSEVTYQIPSDYPTPSFASWSFSTKRIASRAAGAMPAMFRSAVPLIMWVSVGKFEVVLFG